MSVPSASIIVCTTRPESYQALVASLQRQTEQAYELITIRERGPLAALRNDGLRRVHAPVVCVIDDDTVCPPTWLAGLLRVFEQHPEVVGVSGPAIIPAHWRANRHLFRYPWLTRLYTACFLDRDRRQRPGTVCRSGAVTLVSADADCTYEGPVDYLEACNMAFRTDALRAVGGFDEAYTELAEWCEPDVCFRLRALYPGRVCWFTPAARLYHQPARGGATVRRRKTRSRLANVLLFQARWVPPSWRRDAYQTFLRAYFLMVELGVVKP